MATFEFTGDVGELASVRAFVHDCCVAAWNEAPADWLNAVVLAVHEAAANIVLHAYRDQPRGPIRLQVRSEPNRVIITLLHQGLDFDPAAVCASDPASGKPSGYGVQVLRRCVDELRYLHGDQWRGIRLVKCRDSVKEAVMQLLVEQFDDVTVATPTADRLDVSNADDFRREMDPVLQDTQKLVLDLGRVEFADSRGCGAILSILKNLTERGGDLRICQVTRPVRTVFDLIRLHRLCEIHDTKQQAVAAFKAS